MDLALLFDHRFYVDKNQIIFSLQNYDYSLFANRYLQVFDNIKIISRLTQNPPPQKRTYKPTIGPGVEVLSLGNWHGPFQLLKNYPTIVSKLKTYLPNDSAVIMIAPGTVGSLMLHHLLNNNRPYGVEVVGDPYDSLAPKANTHPLRFFFRWWFSRQLRRQCANACATAYVTQFALQNRYPPSTEAFTTHYSSIELSEEAFVSRPQNTPSDQNSFRLIFVGSLAQLYKAPDVLIEAFALCVQWGLNISLVMVGDGQYRPSLEAKVTATGLKERVTFLGQLPAGAAVRAELDKTDLFILPSLTEGLPRAMIEAMARGLPCIGSTVGGIPELLPAEDMVPPGDVNALAQKIREVVTNPARMSEMAARNLEKAREYQKNILQERRMAMYRHLEQQTEKWLLASTNS